MLKASNGWTNIWFGIGSGVFYVIATILFAYVLKGMNMGIAYVIWSGVGIALICIASAVLWQQKFDIYAIIGVILIGAGTIVITAKSNISI